MMESNFIRRFLEIRIGDRYQLNRRLGEGTFGLVYLGRDVETNNQVAIKLEHHSVAPSLLSQEIDIYESLKGKVGIPQVFWHGQLVDYQVMVFELLGPNLEDLLQYCGGRFTMKTTLMLMYQLLRRIECLHTTGHIHRHIKPENFLLGTGKRGNVVYVTDLGLATYRSTWTERSELRERSSPPRLSLVGTCDYASINGHLQMSSSCRDDLESLGYMAIYFLNGSLPWQSLRVSNKQTKHERVLEMKRTTSVDELCKDLPVEFANYMTYLRDLKDPNKINYAHLRGSFEGLFRRLGYDHDFVFDWTIREFDRIMKTPNQPSPPEANTEEQTKAKSSAKRARRSHKNKRRTKAAAD